MVEERFTTVSEGLVEAREEGIRSMVGGLREDEGCARHQFVGYRLHTLPGRSPKSVQGLGCGFGRNGECFGIDFGAGRAEEDGRNE